MPELSSTSTLVLIWAGDECYRSVKSREYLSQLDTNSGSSLYKQCSKICFYYDEIIKNRKFGVQNLITKCVAEEAGIRQIVIAGAGLDPLGIEITEFYPFLKVFDLDAENMEYKCNLFSNLENASSSNISFINADLLNAPGVYETLIMSGWDPHDTTLLILEGISYYLSTESLRNLIKVINPGRIVFEFLKQNDKINFERGKIAQEVFGLISKACRCPEIVRYSCSQIESLFNLSVITRYSMKKLEVLRKGSNKYFPDEESGWIEVCLLGKRESRRE